MPGSTWGYIPLLMLIVEFYHKSSSHLIHELGYCGKLCHTLSQFLVLGNVVICAMALNFQNKARMSQRNTIGGIDNRKRHELFASNNYRFALALSYVHEEG